VLRSSAGWDTIISRRHMTKGYAGTMAPVEEMPTHTRDHVDIEPAPRTHEISPQTWSSAGQAIATAAGGAAIFGLVVGPEGAAVAALIGGLVGLALALQHYRADRHDVGRSDPD
jgi:hypothetical protein